LDMPNPSAMTTWIKPYTPNWAGVTVRSNNIESMNPDSATPAEPPIAIKKRLNTKNPLSFLA
jgi:hypothetical protein